MSEDSVHEEKKQQIVHIAQERSDHEGFEDEQITESLQERPRQARSNLSGSSDFSPSQTQKRRQRKRKSQKSKPKRQINSNKNSQKINAEANQDGDEDANRTDRDSK